MGKKNEKKAEQAKRSTMRVSVMALCCALGVALLAGMALFNRGVKPDRDMQWYVREGALEVAAPAMGEGYDGEDSEFLLPEDNMRATLEPTPVPTPSPTPVPTQEPAMPDVTAVPEDGSADMNWDASADDTADLTGEDEAALPGEGDTLAQAKDIAEPEGDIFPEAEAEPEIEEEPDPSGTVTLTITAAGDCTFGGMEGAKSHPRFAKLVQKYGYDYFFENVRDVFEDDDLTIINLEGPLTNETRRTGSGFVFKAPPECVKILTGSSVEICNVANNHSRDYGLSGLKETAKVLDENGIGFCGYDVAYEKTIKGVRVCALGFTCWERSNEKIFETVAAHRDSCDLLIVSMHWGDEHVYDFNNAQARQAHGIIDAGADLVIGTHPHVIQGIEKYKNKYIVYSLGNFSFAGNANPDDKRCLIFQQTFSFAPGMNIYRAGCADAGINLIPASITSTEGTNDFRPMVLPADKGASVLKLLAKKSKGLDLKNTLWMKDNYMVANGLIKGKDEQGTAPQTADAGADLEDASENALQEDAAENADQENPDAEPAEETEAEDEEAVAAAAFEEVDGDFGDAGADDAGADIPFEDDTGFDGNDAADGDFSAGDFAGDETVEDDEPSPFFS